MVTWLDIKIATLQKMFASSSTTLVQNATTTPYLNAMPAVANRGLQLLSTAGKFIVKSHEITQDGTGTGVVQKYDFTTLVNDFYDFQETYFDDGEVYIKFPLQTEGKGIFVLPTSLVGTWTVYYYAYPQQITKDTPDATAMSLDPEIAAILPTYIASELMMEDETGKAIQYRNEFEVAREALKPTRRNGIVFVSESGW